MEQAIAYVLGSFGLIILFVSILAVTCDVQSLRNKIVYKILNMCYNIYVLN